MEAKDLRIGNYVKYNGMILSVIGINHPVPCKDERYANKWVIDLLCDGIITATIEEIDPVPLTEEWLIKSGFEKIEGEWHYHKNLSALNAFARSCSRRLYFEIGGIYIGEITHAHRLQNIWHSLSNGQELTLKP